VLVIFEGYVRAFDLAFSFDVDRVVPVNENVGDGRVFEQWLEWPKSEELVLHVTYESITLCHG
jgi:hypothetical protein